MNKFYLTTPIYYASGAPHVGHAFSTLYADILARYKKHIGCDVFFATGMDEHGSKIEKKAQDLEKNTQEFVDELAVDYLQLWRDLAIDYTDFIRTTSDRHKQAVALLLEKLLNSGDVYLGDYTGLYCAGCEDFLTEKSLVGGVCPYHKQAPQEIKEKNYFFNLQKYLPAIQEKIKKDEIKVIPESRKNEVLSILDGDLPDLSISRERSKVGWGIVMPSAPDQTVYVWVEALMNYMSVLNPTREDIFGGNIGDANASENSNFQKYWPADVHIIGAEINKFHSIFWPALLMALDLPLPREIFVHGLFTVNGEKMSKTIGNVIDPREMIAQFGVDGTRYLLLSQFPAYEHGDIKKDEFVTKYNGDLADGLGNLFERSLKMIGNPRDYADDAPIDSEVEAILKKARENYHQNMGNYNFYGALRDIMLLTRDLNVYINEQKPWAMKKTNDEKLPQVLAGLNRALNLLTDLITPFFPEKAQKIHEFNQSGGGERLGLFPRVE